MYGQGIFTIDNVRIKNGKLMFDCVHTAEVDGDNKPETITAFSQNMLARDSMALRRYINDISPDIDLTSEIKIGGEAVSVSIPLTVEFFWPKSV